MLFFLMILIDWALFAVGFIFLVPMPSSLLWLEILIGVVGGLLVSCLIRGLKFYIIGVINSHFKTFNKFNVWYIKVIMSMIIFFTRCKVTYEGLENIDKDKTYLFIANHKSNVDFMYCYKPIKQNTSVLAKKEFETSFVAKYGKMINALYVDRSSDKEGAKTVIEAIRLCKSGVSVLVYPEGKRSDASTSKMLEAHSGTYKIALKSKVDILPITCINGNKIASNMPWHRTKIKVIFHKPVSYDEFKDLQTVEIEGKIRNIINEPINE